MQAALTNTCAPLTVGYPGNSCGISIVFTPTVSGTRSATLKLTDNATGSPQSISLTGVGEAPLEMLYLNPTAMTFGTVSVGGASGPVLGTIYNTGSAGVTITGFSISGANASDFAFYSNNCLQTIPAGSTCQYQFFFKPTATGVRTATLQIADNAVGGPQSITLSGAGK